MTPQEIKIGTRLELELLNKIGEKVGYTYVSQLLEQQESNCMVISAPIFEAKLIFIPRQAQLRLTLMHHKYGLFSFTALVTGSEYRGNIAVLLVQSENNLVKMQRRTYFRLDIMADILITPSGNNTNTETKKVIKAFTKNISGSGVCVITETDIPKKSEVDIELILAGNIMIKAKCIVMRNNRFEVKMTKNYELGMHFIDISKKDQNSLIKYIFEQQRVQLKK